MQKIILILGSLITLTIANNACCMKSLEIKKPGINSEKKVSRKYTPKFMKSLKKDACKKHRLNITKNALIALKENSKINSTKNSIRTSDLLDVLIIKKIAVLFEKNSKQPSLVIIAYKIEENKNKYIKLKYPDTKKTSKSEIQENITLIASKMLLLKDLQVIYPEMFQSQDLNDN